MARLAERLRDPVLWSEISQLAKTVAAAVPAWVTAARVFGLVQPFLAPCATLLTVHATAYPTLARGAQLVSAVLGVLFAWAAGSTLGINVVSLGLVLLAAMARSSSTWPTSSTRWTPSPTPSPSASGRRAPTA